MFNILFAALAFAVSAVCALTGGYVSEGYDLRPGMISHRRIQSPRDVVNEGATRVRQEQAAEAARSVLVYRQDDDITTNTMNVLYAFFGQIDSMRRLHSPLADPTQPEREPVPVSELDRSRLPLDISTTSHFTFLITAPSEVYIGFRDKIFEITEQRMLSGVREDALSGVYLVVRDELAMIDEWDSVVRNAGYNIISQVLRQNVFIDTESMEIAAQAAIDATPPVIIQRGQNIVIEGALITPEIYAILETLGLVRSSIGERLAPSVGVFLCVAAVFIVGMLFLTTVYARLFEDRKNVVLLFTLYVLTVFIAWLIQGVSFVFVPVLLFTMLAAVLLDEGLAVGFCLCVSIVCAVIFMGDMRFVAFYVITGLFVSITSKLITERSKMLSVTALMSLFSFLTVCAVYLVADRAATPEMWDTAVMAALFGMFSVVLCVGILPFFETAFGFVTAIKLVDLANPNNPLLRRLIIEAPGTYQHSLVVSNLAETACYSIGANHTLARIGGYYHDCGKINYPGYFIENQSGGVNPHDKMNPFLSVKIISEHVTNGLAFADSYKLPKPVRAFIEEHHGGSVQRFFFHKAKEIADKKGRTVNEDDFRYKQRIPQSREVAVVMLADIVEAAVRSMMPAGKMTMEELPEYITTLIRTPLLDGRLADSGLIIKDLTTITEAFMRVFRGMFHERVAYPDTPRHEENGEGETNGEAENS
ncbi:MAG: HDIG domain-containing protein [Defluviitaleaceae bacterium]|nr:HDIG domain-containing protein [Defluviitaleaceae bacterium]